MCISILICTQPCALIRPCSAIWDIEVGVTTTIEKSNAKFIQVFFLSFSIESFQTKIHCLFQTSVWYQPLCSLILLFTIFLFSMFIHFLILKTTRCNKRPYFLHFRQKLPKQLYQNIFFNIFSQFDQIISSGCLMLGMSWQFRKCSFSRAKKVSCSTKKCHKCRYIRLS